jgi:hypothetical protein
MVHRGLAYAVALGIMLAVSGQADAQGAAPTPAGAARNQVQSPQQHMRDQPDLMDAITALQADPDFEEVLADPDIAAALQTGNYDALLTNPKIIGLTSNPKVRELTNQLTR